MDTFAAGSMIRFGWETFKKRVWFFVAITLIIGVINALASGITSTFGQQGVGQVAGSIVGFLLGTLISMGIVAFFLKAHDAPEAAEGVALWHPQAYLKFLAARLLIGAAVVVGILLLIIPGVIFGLMFMFAPYLVIDKGLGPIEAMKQSKLITSGHKWQLLGLCVLLGLINILGAICLLVGLLVTVPVTSLAIVHAYRTLSSHEHPHVSA